MLALVLVIDDLSRKFCCFCSTGLQSAPTLNKRAGEDTDTYDIG